MSKAGPYDSALNLLNLLIMVLCLLRCLAVLQRHIVRAMNYLVALFFAMDAVMKMIAQGVLLTPTAYFQVRFPC